MSTSVRVSTGSGCAGRDGGAAHAQLPVASVRPEMDASATRSDANHSITRVKRSQGCTPGGSQMPEGLFLLLSRYLYWRTRQGGPLGALGAVGNSRRFDVSSGSWWVTLLLSPVRRIVTHRARSWCVPRMGTQPQKTHLPLSPETRLLVVLVPHGVHSCPPSPRGHELKSECGTHPAARQLGGRSQQLRPGGRSQESWQVGGPPGPCSPRWRV